MQETRRQRLQSVILEELSVMVSREVKDPRIPAITFTSCEVTQDASQATLFVSILGAMAADDTDSPAARKRMQECLDGLHSAGGFLRRALAKILNIRHTPQLIFKEDKGLVNSTRVHELLKKLDDERAPGSAKPEAKSPARSTASDSE